MAQLLFDATKVAPAAERGAVPKGQYKVLVAHSDIKPGKTNPTDRMVTAGLKIVDGPIAGSIINTNYNIVHSNPTAQEIAQSQFSALCHAVGVLQIRDTSELHGRLFQVKVSVRTEPDGKSYNDIDAYLTENGTPVVGSGGGTPVAQGQTAAPPTWAQQGAPAQPAAPTPAPAQPQAPYQPPTPAPQQPQAPTPAPEKKVFVAIGASVVTPAAIPASQAVAQFGATPGAQVCVEGTQQWQPIATITPAQPQAPQPGVPTPAAGALAPWLQQQQPTA